MDKTCFTTENRELVAMAEVPLKAFVWTLLTYNLTSLNVTL
jgi:hypothetical protein